jgi:hypothetical protein
MESKKILFLVIFFSFWLNAIELKRDGWNLVAVCQNIKKENVDMTGIEQIQSLEGKNIYTGSKVNRSSLHELIAGYGYWVKGTIGTNFDSGTFTGKLEVALTREGWNIIGACENRVKEDVDMTGLEQIQSLEGKNIYTGSKANRSSLHELIEGYAYWVKGNIGTTFLSKDGEQNVALPEGYDYRVINNSGMELENSVEINGAIFAVRIYSNQDVVANDQVNHVGIFSNVNGQNSTFQIQNSYANVVVAVYDETDRLIAVSEVTVVNGNTQVTVNF